MYLTYFVVWLWTLEKVGARVAQADLWPVIPDCHQIIIISMILQSGDWWQYEEQTMFLNRWRCIDFLAQVVYTDSDVPSAGLLEMQVRFQRLIIFKYSTSSKIDTLKPYISKLASLICWF